MKNIYEILISTHTPHAGRDHNSDYLMAVKVISTHTPHAGRDNSTPNSSMILGYFYSHAPCGARLSNRNVQAVSTNFYSHAPCGARLFCHPVCSDPSQFLLTRPMRGATSHEALVFRHSQISTHTPHAGRDVALATIISLTVGFLLTRPMRGATGLVEKH